MKKTRKKEKKGEKKSYLNVVAGEAKKRGKKTEKKKKGEEKTYLSMEEKRRS